MHVLLSLQPAQVAYLLAEKWTGLSEKAKAEWGKKSLQAFEEDGGRQEKSTHPAKKKRKTQASRGEIPSDIGEIKGRVMQILEDADLEKVSLQDVHRKLAKVYAAGYLKENKAAITELVNRVKKSMQERAEKV